MGNTPILPATSIINPWLENEAIPNPGVGNDLSNDFKDNLLSELIFLEFQFTADANAADRFPVIGIQSLAVTQEIATGNIYTTANSFTFYRFAIGFTNYQSPDATHDFSPLPPGIRLTDQSKLLITIVNKQAGDQITSAHVIWNRWPSFSG